MFLFVATHANTALKRGSVYAHITHRVVGYDSQMIHTRINTYICFESLELLY